MKSRFILPIFLVVALAGCASTEYAQYSKAQTDIATARHTADAAKYKALADIAASGDSSAKVAAVMALALGGGQGAGPVALAAPQSSSALQWASILVPGLTQVAGMRYAFLSQQTASNNATSLGISTNSTFAGIAGKIQAPGSVTTNTLSGTGALGGGTYTTSDNHTTSTLSGTGTLGSGAYSTVDNHTTSTLSGTGALGGGGYATTDNHTTTPASLVVNPVVQSTPTL